MEIDQYSRLNFYKSGESSIDVFQFDVDMNSIPVDGVHYVTDIEVERPWLIADVIYGIPRLWWFIAKFNGLKRLDRDLYAGMPLKYPSLSVYFELKGRYLS